MNNTSNNYINNVLKIQKCFRYWIKNRKYNNILVNIIKVQKEKENKKDIWENSPYKEIVKLQSNNVGIVGETFVQKICELTKIPAQINGAKNKKKGGGDGDGIILGKKVEIKTAHLGSSYTSFQHELGENPWKSKFLIFIDIAPQCIYITIITNYDEFIYKSNEKLPDFPTKSITWRKKLGAFKLDTTIKINESNIGKCTIKYKEGEDLCKIEKFIRSKIK